MKSKLLGHMALVSLVLALSGGAARAMSCVNFDWSTSGPLGSGCFTATNDGGGQYTITAISGTFDGGTISSLIAPGGYDGNDNLLFYPGTPQLDFDGFSFLEGTDKINIYYDAITGNYYVEQSFEEETITLDGFAASPVITPLPAALPLFATGIGAMGLLGWRRKRKNAGVIAAA
jgi:hypothetical protein